jgi:hypothetical protein
MASAEDIPDVLRVVLVQALQDAIELRDECTARRHQYERALDVLAPSPVLSVT